MSERERFEAWRHQYDPHGSMEDDEVHHAWIAWQAAAPPETPSAEVERVMGLVLVALEGRFKRGLMRTADWDADQSRINTVRAEVERLADVNRSYLIAGAETLERAERAEEEAAANREDAERWRALKPYFRVMSPDIDGRHYWTLRGGLPRGATMDEVADTARKESK